MAPKGHDESSRRSEAQAAEVGVTPRPEIVSTDDGQAAKPQAAGSRRVHSSLSRERSGPIGIASGDFATPSVRRRTTTQPRGTPIAGVPLDLDPPLSAPVAPAPAIEPLPVGATPVDLVDARASGRTPAPPPVPTDGPFGAMEGSGGDLDNEAAVLAAEAAAVRALDSGPMTPLPEVAPTAPTPPPEVAAAPSPTEVDVEFEATPPPEPHATAASAETSAPTDAPAPDIAGALPVRPMGSDGSAASADLPTAMVAATPAPAPVAATESEVQGDEIEVLEAKEGVAGSAAAAPTPTPAPTSAARETSQPAAASPPSTPRPTPPPIPGSYLKTPGPELRIAPQAGVEDGRSPLLPALPILPEALSLRPRRPKRSKPWFEEVFDEDYLRTLPFMRADQTLREVEFISNALQTDPGAEILDVGCGYGRHAIELVQRGFNVTGLDLSLPLLIRAADEAQRRALSVNFVHADMREMSFENQFDGAYSMLTSFGYFDEETNLRVAERIGRALKPGRRFLLDVINRDYVVADLPVRVWWEGTGCVVLEEVDFNFHTSRINTHRSIVFEDGRQLEQELSVRAYSLHEIGRLLRQAGFRVIDVSGGLALKGQFFGGSSRSLLIVAEKRDEDA
jgi:SAM-dependent methyltransferase